MSGVGPITGPDIAPLALVPWSGVSHVTQQQTAANRGHATFATLTAAATITGIRIKVVSGATGNVSVALYDAAFNRLATSGAVACPANIIATIPFTAPITVPPGNYWLAFSTDSALPFYSVTNAGGSQSVMGIKYQENAHPLPQTFVPAGVTSLEYAMMGIISGGWAP